jgi:hypothetical protein
MKLRANIVQSEQRLLNLRNPRPRVIKNDNTPTTVFFDRKHFKIQTKEQALNRLFQTFKPSGHYMCH